MANSWQEARNRRAVEEQQHTAQTLYAGMIEAMRQEVVSLKNQVVEKFVCEELGIEVILDLTPIMQRGYVAQAEDGSEVFHWDGKPRIYFAPIDMQEVDGTMRPVLKWQRIPLVADPAPEEEDEHGLTVQMEIDDENRRFEAEEE